MTVPRRALLPILWLGVTVMFLAGPILVSRMGAYMRFVGDDYCYTSARVSGGFVAGQLSSYRMIERFNGDRYSLTLVSFVTGLFGPPGYSAAVAVMLMLWLAGLFITVYQLLRILGFEQIARPSLAIASLVTFFILLTNADRFSSIYWVSAYYSYFGAMAAIVWLTAAILTLRRAHQVKWWSLLTLFAMAWIFGAFSEVGTVVQIVWLILMALVFLIIEGRRFWQRDYRLFLASMLGTSLALLTMLESPYAQTFLSSGIPNTDFLYLSWRILRSATDYYWSPWEVFTTPFLVESLALVSIGFLLGQNNMRSAKVDWIRFGFILLAILLSGWLLVTVAFSPSYIVLGSSPSVRALTPAQVIRQISWAMLALVVGWFASRRLKAPNRVMSLAEVVVPLMILATSMYPLRAYPYLVERESFMKKWAVLWDRRDSEIREAVEKGELQVHVMALDHPIPWVAELGPDPDAGYNVCAQEYYGLPAIIADLPGWDSFDPP